MNQKDLKSYLTRRELEFEYCRVERINGQKGIRV